MRRTGFTLLEVILALSILSRTALAVLVSFSVTGLHSSQCARDLSRATLFCEAKLAELTAAAAAGTAVPQSVGPVAVENEIGWVYSIEVADTTSPDMLAVHITVMPDLPPEKKPVSASAVRMDSSILRHHGGVVIDGIR